jgi:Phage tail tube protein
MADTSQRRSGVFALNVDGTDYDVVDGVTYILSTVKRETNIGISGIQGYKETFVSGQIKAKLRDSNGFLAALFTNLTASSVIGQAANGKTVSGTGMWTTEPVEVDPIEGTFEVTFEGAQVREILNA